MKLSTKSATVLLALLVSVCIPVPMRVALAQDHNQDYKLGALEISHPWSRATPKSADTAAGYLTVKNTGDTADRLVSATFSDAATAQIHQMTMDNGVMRMRELANGLEIKPGETVELKPASYHIMFMGLKQPLVKGQTVSGTLTFEKAGTINVDFAVEATGASAPQGASEMQHDQMQMDHMH
jgi:periplasmic copper chaperone A